MTATHPHAGLGHKPRAQRRFPTQRRGAYKVPRELKLVDAIQRTPSGKADHRWAKQQFETERAVGS